jgi:hypothetical protein
MPIFFAAGNRVPAIQNSMMIDQITSKAAGARIAVLMTISPISRRDCVTVGKLSNATQMSA